MNICGAHGICINNPKAEGGYDCECRKPAVKLDDKKCITWDYCENCNPKFDCQVTSANFVDTA